MCATHQHEWPSFVLSEVGFPTNTQAELTHTAIEKRDKRVPHSFHEPKSMHVTIAESATKLKLSNAADRRAPITNHSCTLISSTEAETSKLVCCASSLWKLKHVALAPQASHLPLVHAHGAVY